MTKRAKSVAPRIAQKRATVPRAVRRGAVATHTPTGERPRLAPALERPSAGDIASLSSVVRQLVDAARHHAGQAINIALTHLHWQVGRRIQCEILGQKRGEYG